MGAIAIITAAEPSLPLPRMQRARGEGRIAVAAEDGRTRLVSLYQEGCAKIRLPNTHDGSAQAVLINTAGGLTGGDRIDWHAKAGPASRLVLTTQACERIYRSTGTAATVETRLFAGAGARLDWLPQETILFAGSQLERRLEVDLEESASFLAVEAVILGREAMGEEARDARLSDRWRIRRAGRLVHAEATSLTGTATERDGLSTLSGHRAFATLLLLSTDAGAQLDQVRGLIGPNANAGASATTGRLVVRAAAPSGLALRQIIAPILATLSSAGSLPRLWHL